MNLTAVTNCIDAATDILRADNDAAKAREDYDELLLAVEHMFEDLALHYGLTREKLVNDDYEDGGFQIADKHIAFRARSRYAK